MSAAADGDTSRSNASCAGSSARDVTVTPVSIRPPCASMSATRASTMRCVPPSATTQPWACAAAVSVMPTALVSGRSKRQKAWAATPAQSARAWGVDHSRPSVVAGGSTRIPNRTRVTGWRGIRMTGWEMSANRSSKCAATGANTCRQRRPSTPSRASVSSNDRANAPAVPSSSGWAQSTSAARQDRPGRSRSRNSGDANAIGCAAEQ